RSPRDRDPLPSRGTLAQGARDPEGGGFLAGAQPARRDRCVGGERGSDTAEILAVMPKGGLEPPRACAHWLLKPARLPVPPLRRGSGTANLRRGITPSQLLA